MILWYKNKYTDAIVVMYFKLKDSTLSTQECPLGLINGLHLQC